MLKEKEEKKLREVVDPIGAVVGEGFVDAIVMRINLHLTVAFDNGAEVEDIPRIINESLEATEPLVRNFIRSVADMPLCDKYLKERKDG